MALSPISAVGGTTSFIPPPVVPRALSPVERFVQALDTSLNTSTTATVSGLNATTTQQNFVAALERALFSNFVASVQNNNASTLSPIIDSILAGEFGITNSNTQAVPFDTSDPASLVLTARMLSLFSSMQLLGTEVNTNPAIGSLLNTSV